MVELGGIVKADPFTRNTHNIPTVTMVTTRTTAVKAPAKKQVAKATPKRTTATESPKKVTKASPKKATATKTPKKVTKPILKKAAATNQVTRIRSILDPNSRGRTKHPYALGYASRPNYGNRQLLETQYTSTLKTVSVLLRALTAFKNQLTVAPEPSIERWASDLDEAVTFLMKLLLDTQFPDILFTPGAHMIEKDGDE